MAWPAVNPIPAAADVFAVSTSVPPPGYEPPVASASAPEPASGPAKAPVGARPARVAWGRLGPPAPRLLAGLVGLAVLLGFGLLGLGGGSSPVSDPIAQAATLSSSSPGYRMNLAMTLSIPSVSAPLSASGSAIVDLRDQAASVSMGIDFSKVPQAASALGSSTMRIDMILERGAMYMKLPAAITDRLPGFGGKPWIGMNLTKLRGLPGLSSLGNDPTMSDPSRMLQYLRAESSSVTSEGQQQVDGVETTHYHAVLNLDGLASKVPALERTVVEQALANLRQATHLHGLPVDVWIDAHHLVRRIVMALSVPAGGGNVQETVTGDMTDYGPQPLPAVPPADQVQDLSSLVKVQG